MVTYQEFLAESDRAAFIARAISLHEADELTVTARTANEYDAQRNTAIKEFVQTIFSASGNKLQNVVASNKKRASNFFRRLNVQRNTYSLGNGVTFTKEETKEKLGGDAFDVVLSKGTYKALIHGVSFLFLNKDRVHVFPVTEFCPMYDEMTGELMAGIRYWRLDEKKPSTAVLYEPDGYTVYVAEKGNEYRETEKKRAYILNLSKAPADAAAEVTGEKNYDGRLPIVPLWGSELRQSTLVGMKDGIDNYDLISNGWCNDLSDCAQIYWILENYGGMDEAAKANFRAQLLYEHIATADTTDGGKITPYTPEIPFAAREAYLNMLKADIYSDFGALDVAQISAGEKTATEIRAAYQPMDENADDFEYQIIESVKKMLALLGIEDAPQFKRNRIANIREEVEMVLSEANYLDDETVLELLPNITPEMIEEILKRRDANALANLSDMEKLNEAVDEQNEASE